LASDLAALIGLVGALFLVVIAIASVCLPFAVFSIASSLRGILYELQRLNGGAIAADVKARASAAAFREAARPQDLGHTLLR
jgi:hypothetical protein